MMYPRLLVLDHTHLKMAWVKHQIQQKDGYLSYSPPLLSSSSSPPYPPGAAFHKDSPPSTATTATTASSGTRISPAVLFIIVVLAVLFFISGVLHLLVRFLIKYPSSSASAQSNRHPEISTSDALQRQLQQLFHLHDSGLDQAFIDALPVFQYKEIVGLKEPFDCAVCLCEFSEKDKLRLLPMCSHAFHISCIDTWLLSNSTCPLCRGTLLTQGFSIENPIFDFDDLREDEGNGESGFSSTRQKTVVAEESVEKGVFPVRLGKFKKLSVEGGEREVGETSSSNLDARRCYSMGSYQYVVGNSELRVALNHEIDKGQNTRLLTKGMDHDDGKFSVEGDVEAKKISSVSKGDSFSVSKIWLWPKKGKLPSSLDAQMAMPVPSFLNTDFQRRRETEGV
ncbi:RING-H2 finger protein ATL46-like [Vigna unguiculata]|nr:RING-H2 finger protein ATL46-like [Vigna unguiculata]XP_027924479.1 RING-H2 finger protein ATL46-like [Vigna unguiculata]XP_027924480.1 RING-H2 finger protein ATL46-like [Vigna unguiculata]